MFLATMGVWLLYVSRTIDPCLRSPAVSPCHRRLYRCHHVSRFPVKEYLGRPRELEDDTAVEQTVPLLYTAMVTIIQ
ncbi:MAG TPA: hypothetical protein VLG48_02915 [Candidatus Methylomirabilis sp.]|nr:hypothetical protein [Candidatus Methylomirabilis sp.]